jgi:signal transduction histidine kinase
MERFRLRLAPSNGVLLGLLALSLAAISANGGTAAAAFHDSIGPLAALTVAASVLVWRPRRRRPWLLLSAGMLLLGLGNVAFESGWGTVAGDTLYVAGLVLLTLSLAVLIAAGAGRRAARMLFVDAAAVFLAATTALWFFVFDGRFESVSASASAHFDFMALPVLDLFLLALTARLVLTGAVRIVSYRLLAAGIAVGGVGDLLWRGLGASGHSTVWVSSSYYASYLLLAAAALHPSMRELSEIRVPEEETLTRLRVLFLGCSSAVVPIVLATRHGQLRGDPKDFIVLALAATLIPLLVGYRLVDLARIARATAAALRGSEELYRSVVESSQQAEKMESIGQLAGGVAHDFNNLLLAIRGYGELAVRELETQNLDAAEQDIREMLHAADRATDLTRQLLAFGRRQVLMPELLELGELISAAADLLRPMLQPQIELRVLPADGPVLVRADRSQLTQVITNLAANARDAMPDGGTLTIAVAATNTEALLTIADTGTGMGNDTAAQIFEPFFTTKAHKGMGMGLATVHGIVDQSGGSIGVETAPDAGTLFTIRLPLVREESPFRTELAPVAEEGIPLAATVMLVEDTAVVRAVVHAFLEADGYRILEAERGEDALELARGHDGPIDIVLTDIVLPGMDGKQTAEELRSDRPAVTVLYMSGYTNDPELQAGHLPPRTAFIQKPFTADQLRDALRSLAGAC